jgi:heptosyltransferase-2
MLRAAAPGRRVLFLTKERFAGVLRGHPDVDRFYALEDGSSDPAEPGPWGVKGNAGDLRVPLRREGIEEIFDLQQNWRSGAATRALDGAGRPEFAKHGLRRRLLVHARWSRPTPVAPLLQRYRALAGLPPSAPLRPWLRDALSVEERSRAEARVRGLGARRLVLIAPGARWATKRWPARHAAALAVRVTRELDAAPMIAVAPGDSALEAALKEALAGMARGEPGVPAAPAVPILSLGVRETAAVAARAAAIVASDSALLHFGPALGVPAVGLFGSTIPGFGFASGEPRDAVAEVHLSCRPCDVHGKDRCPRGHHACMERLEPALVMEKLKTILGTAT